MATAADTSVSVGVSGAGKGATWFDDMLKLWKTNPESHLER